ncbi:MAG: hypothetical protein PVJ57_02485 [Phycisphaerae bacterium]|jgi:hypothetical protein
MFQPEELPELMTPDVESGVLVADDDRPSAATATLDAVEDGEESQESWLLPDGALGLCADGRRRGDDEDEDLDAGDDEEDEEVDDEDDFYDDDFDEEEEDDDDDEFDAFVDDDDE